MIVFIIIFNKNFDFVRIIFDYIKIYCYCIEINCNFEKSKFYLIESIMRINYPKNLPLVKIPQEAELAIFLIRQELKSRTLTNNFNEMGFDGSICISDFSDLIFSIIGLDDKSDKFYEWYLKQLDVFCKDVDLSEGATLSKQAFDFYVHLMIEKRGQGEK